MEINGTQTIAAPRQEVWDALNDPEILKRCLPGCESVERTGADEFRVVMAAAIGPLRARFNGVLRMTDAQPPASCTMVFEGQGGAVGFGKGSSTVSLAESEGVTTLAYTANAQVGGKLAQVGSRLIDSVARKMSDDFFKAFRQQLAPADPLASEAAAPVAARPSVPRPATTAAGGAHASSSATAASPAAAPAATVAVPPPPIAAPSTPFPDRSASGTGGVVMVPGWWLAVAAALGSIATLAGALLVR